MGNAALATARAPQHAFCSQHLTDWQRVSTCCEAYVHVQSQACRGMRLPVSASLGIVQVL